MPTLPEDIRSTAARCNQFGMCKLNFLGTGVCPPGKKYRYAAYYPQGRMEIVNALGKRLIPVTERLVHIAETCTLCDICDVQCAYLTQLRIHRVMKALVDHVQQHLAAGGAVHQPAPDEALVDLRAAVGEEWATNDPAILVSYSRDCGLLERRMPRYVVMPRTAEEVSQVVRIAKARGLACTPRSNGANAQGLALGDGIILDLMRMSRLEIDRGSWCATIGPGVTAFELQRAAAREGMRACVAEPAAGVIANTLFSRINTLFNHAYGTGGDFVIDAQLVDGDGRIFSMNDPDAPNLRGHRKRGPEALYFLGFRSPRICTQMTIKLFPRLEDEECVFVPFGDLPSALRLTRELGRRRLGYGVGVASAEYVSFFLTLTDRGARELREVLEHKLKARYFVVFVGDKLATGALTRMVDAYIDQSIATLLMQSVSKLHGNEGVELLAELPARKRPYEVVLKPEMAPLLEMTLSPSLEDIVEYVEDDLKDSFRKLFSKPGSPLMSFVWLNDFRINSARIGRADIFYPLMFWVSLDQIDELERLRVQLDEIGARYGVRSGFGYSNTIDLGKWAVIEYDFYYSNDPEKQAVKDACVEAAGLMAKLRDSGQMHMVPSGAAVFQGQCTTDSLMYDTERPRGAPKPAEARAKQEG